MSDEEHIIKFRERLESAEIQEDFDCLRQITVDVSNICGENCPFCPQSHGWKSSCGEFMSVETALELERRMDESGYSNRVTICGKGEPMLNPHVGEIVDIFSRNREVSLITNGMDAGRDAWEHMSAKCVEILVSCHEWNALEQYRRRFAGLGNVLIRNHDKRSPSMILSNRGGFLGKSAGCGTCYYPFYQMNVEPDGTYRPCHQNWKNYDGKRRGTYNMSIKEFFLGEMEPIREAFFCSGKRTGFCAECDCRGDVMGQKFVEYWGKRHEAQV